MADFTIKANDRLPVLDAVLSNLSGPIDLTTATQVRFIMKSTAFTVTGVCTVVNALTGAVRYTWAAGDTANPGEYQLEFEITWPGPKLETVPNDSYKSVSVLADLG